MRKNIKILIMVLLIFCLVGCKKNNEEDGKNKVIAELKYYDGRIIELLNNLNNLSFQNYRLTSKTVELTESSENTSSSKGQANTSGSEGRTSTK